MIDDSKSNDEHNKDGAQDAHDAVQAPPPPRVLVSDIGFDVHLLLHPRLHIRRRDPAHLLHIQGRLRRQRQREPGNNPAKREDEAEDEAEDLRVPPVEEHFASLVHRWRAPEIPARRARVLVQMR
jgi:hypothetical protein